MVKNKEDDFLGDHITNNIKYGDNEWQAQGTVDRDSVYTKESILHLLFEGFDYKKDLGDYEKYVARASTESVTTATKEGAKSYVAAKLQHDLYLVDKLYYISTAYSCSKNIFDVKTYFKKAIAVSNPVYDNNSITENIRLIPDNFPSNLKVIDILKYLSPYWYSGQLSVSTTGDITFRSSSKTDQNVTASSAADVEAQLINIVDRYKKAWTKDLLEKLQAGYTVEAPDLIPGVTSKDVLKMSLKDFLTHLGKSPTVKVNGIDKTAKEIFLDDFTISLHDIETIKMPFNRRGSITKDSGNTLLTEDSDTKTYLTRFLANSASLGIYENAEGSAKINLHYQEFLNDILEEALFANNLTAPIYSGRASVDSDIETSTVLANDFINDTKASGDYVKSFSDANAAEKASLETVAKIIDNAAALIALYCPDVYVGYTTTKLPETSWGIHYLNEENTENLFQDKDESYSVYNNVLLGYHLADALLSLRTPIGGFLFLQKISSSVSQRTSSVYTITQDVPILQREQSAFFSDFVTDELEFYPTVSMLNNIYKVAHGIAVDEQERNYNDNYSYNFAAPIKRWLENECILFKGPVYGDYVEEINFLQDLTPDSNVHFNSLRAKKTTIPYRRFQDSKYEIPFVEQTAPLLNNTKDDVKGFGVYGSDAFAGTGNLRGFDQNKTQNTMPPFIYDWDKGDQEADMATVVDTRILSQENAKQRVHSKQGLIVAEDGILSPTIDELWTFLKYLTESDGSGTDRAINERLPKFYGVKKLALGESFENSLAPKAGYTTNSKNTIVTNRLNPLHTVSTDSEKVIDILGWQPVSRVEKELSYSSEIKPELQFGGYKVTRYIEKIYDYEIQPFSRRDVLDNTEYEFNTEVSGDFNNLTGYLEKLYNQAILEFDLAHDEIEGLTARSLYLSNEILDAHPLRDSYYDDKKTVKIFTKKNDAKIKTSKPIVHQTAERQKAFIDVAKLLNYHKADGTNDFVLENGVRKDTSYHNHFKKYLDHPKNLKEIERDLETIRQNLQTLAEFMVSTYTPLGYADRARNRGTLHQLHKNAYEWLSTWLLEVNQTAKSITDNTYHVDVVLRELTDSLNDIERTFDVVDADKKVAFDDGPYIDRYLHDWYDHFVLDLDSNVNQHISNRHPMYRANETLLSEVYLAADGTWRSVHEHTVLPVVYSDH